ncbi:MAG TPA: ABC transporter permease/substrate-binding protein [Pseudolabrys sp.]|nr:ABC transporter permease/substrate-binding protein [Pseudolabrys sp.]
MNLDRQLADALAHLPDYLGSHVLVSVSALALGLAISLPLAILCLRRPLLRGGLLAFASVIQTIPGLALLALFYPLLLALAALSERLFGVSFSALGFWPAVLALALYSILPVLRNTVVGLGQIDDGLRDAARALALTPRQTLRLIDLPIALPVIMAGVRTSAVWVIGTATLATPIGQTSLGNYIFAGLQTQNWVFVVFGCVAAAALALLVEQLLTQVERGLATRNRARIAASAATLAVVVLAALAPALGGTRASYVVGTKNFTEQYILGALIQQRLAAAGLSSNRRDGLGSAVIFKALTANDVDVYVDYSGTIWANQMGRTDVKPRADVLKEMAGWLKATHGVRLLGALGFENAYALAMPRAKADALGINSIADLAAHAPQLAIGGDFEFFDRPEWQSLRQAYGLEFRTRRSMQPAFMYQAAVNGEVDVISAFSSDGRIAQYDLKVLSDPKHALPPYDAIVLIGPARAADRKLMAALKPLIGAIPVTTMQEANLRAATTGAAPAEVAEWLWRKVAGTK